MNRQKQKMNEDETVVVQEKSTEIIPIEKIAETVDVPKKLTEIITIEKIYEIVRQSVPEYILPNGPNGAFVDDVFREVYFELDKKTEKDMKNPDNKTAYVQGIIRNVKKRVWARSGQKSGNSKNGETGPDDTEGTLASEDPGNEALLGAELPGDNDMLHDGQDVYDEENEDDTEAGQDIVNGNDTASEKDTRKALKDAKKPRPRRRPNPRIFVTLDPSNDRVDHEVYKTAGISLKQLDEGMLSIEKINIVSECLDSLNHPHAKQILLRFDGEGETARAIAVDIDKDEQYVFRTERKYRKIFKNLVIRKCLQLKIDPLTILYDISIMTDSSKQFPDGVEAILSNGCLEDMTKINGHEEEDMDSEYINMLLHTIQSVAGILPVTDMMHEHLWGRLDQEKQQLLEQHLSDCQCCWEEFEEKKHVIGLLKALHKFSTTLM